MPLILVERGWYGLGPMCLSSRRRLRFPAYSYCQAWMIPPLADEDPYRIRSLDVSARVIDKALPECPQECAQMSLASLPDLPYPGDELVWRVTAQLNREAFLESGRRSVRDIEAVLAVIGKRLPSYPRILDFGCGCARVLLWLKQLAATCSLHAVDIDELAIRWGQEHLPYVSFQVNKPLPPLDYPDGFFDLVYSVSVFTHIDETYQDQWLAELSRITKPGGTLVLSVHGELPFRKFEGAAHDEHDPSPLRRTLDREGFLFVEDDMWLGSAFPDFYHTSFHRPWYVFDRWSRYFTIKAYVPEGCDDFQDFVLLERPSESDLEGGTPGLFGRPTAPPAVGQEHKGPAVSAIDIAADYLARGVDVSAPTRYGLGGRAARRLVLRVLRHYVRHEQEFGSSVVNALREVRNLVPKESELARKHEALREALRQQSDRIGRLENDLHADLRAQERRLGILEASEAPRGGSHSGPREASAAPTS